MTKIDRPLASVRTSAWCWRAKSPATAAAIMAVLASGCYSATDASEQEPKVGVAAAALTSSAGGPDTLCKLLNREIRDAVSDQRGQNKLDIFGVDIALALL